MKKIFAIALALVMVLSMASAFALNNCSGTFSWTCPADVNNCGKGNVEVIPYVKVNTACAPYFDYEMSTCAGAVAGEKVYYAVKLTVDANADELWWAVADLTMTYKGVTPAGTVVDPVWADLKAAIDANKSASSANTFYFDFSTSKWALVDDNFTFGAVNLDSAVVTKPADAKVCAKLESEDSGYNAAGWTYGDYTVVITRTDATGKVGSLTVTNKTGASFTMTWVDGKVNAITATSEAFMNEVKSVFNLGGCVVGTCVTNDIIQANFGWKDKFESCFSWSDKVSAVVNAECVVSIPKTGDVSVVAYAVMAVVAAAGAMLKK